MFWSQEANSSSRPAGLGRSYDIGTWIVTALPAYPPTVTSTGAVASRDAWAARSAAISLGVVAGLFGIVVVQWHGSPYTLNPVPAGHAHARNMAPAPSGGSRPSSFFNRPSTSGYGIQSDDAISTVTATGPSPEPSWPVTRNGPSGRPARSELVGFGVAEAEGVAVDSPPT